jgi:hypothetical protein
MKFFYKLVGVCRHDRLLTKHSPRQSKRFVAECFDCHREFSVSLAYTRRELTGRGKSSFEKKSQQVRIVLKRTRKGISCLLANL